MPTIGVPSNYSEQNPFRNIKMNPTSIQNNSPEEKDLETLDSLKNVKSDRSKLYRTSNNTMGKDEFLKLLTHQLKNQDPMKPTDQTQMAADMAQFAQLEQLTNIQKQMEKSTLNQNIESKFFAASFLGKRILADGNTTLLKDQNGPVYFNLDRPVKDVSIRFLDSQNNIVGEIKRDKLAQGPQTLKWDGITLDGTPSAEGIYTYQIKAFDELNQPVHVETKTSGIVNGVNFKDGEIIFNVNGKNVALRDVDSFELPTH
jgi:flagellar basal-body rod modification protein FlgD